MTTSMDTKVEGDPGAVTTAATWLRDTLAKNLETAGNDQQDARNDARGSWEGETASSYQNFSGDILKSNDKHEERVKRAATALDLLRRQAAALHRRHDRDPRPCQRWRAHRLGNRHPRAGPRSGRHGRGRVARGGRARDGRGRRSSCGTSSSRTPRRPTRSSPSGSTPRCRPTWPTHVRRTPPTACSTRSRTCCPTSWPAAGGGLAGVALLDKAGDYKAEAREFRRRSRVAGDPRVQGSGRHPGRPGQARRPARQGRRGSRRAAASSAARAAS